MSKASSPLLAINELHISVDGKEVVNGIDLEVRPGEVHAIMGPNGSGKSTLAGVLADSYGLQSTFLLSSVLVGLAAVVLMLTKLPAHARVTRSA